MVQRAGRYTDLMATLRDVASMAGVSISMASRVLGDVPHVRVRADTRERIHAAARELDYRPNFAGRALKSARSNVIAMIVPDIANAVFTELMSGVEEGALERDYVVLLGRSEDMQPGGEMIRRLIGEGRVDGMLLQLDDEATREGVDLLLQQRAPLVFINSIEADHVGSVTLHDEEGARVATDHLMGLGHVRIALATGIPNTWTSARRERGFRDAITRAGLSVRESYIVRHGYTPGNGRTALRALMELPEPPTAIFIANVNAAVGALAEARLMGIRVPEELSLIAMHDSWVGEHTWPPLTTVKMPLRELGQRAVQSLHERMHGADPTDVVVGNPAPKVILRESTATPPGKASGDNVLR